MRALEKDIKIKATELFTKYGIRSITMDDISREVGISKKTLYNYIIDKEELVKTVCDNEVQKLSEKLNTIITGSESSIEKYYQLVDFTFRFLSSKSIIAEFDLKKYYPEIEKEINAEVLEILHASFQKIIDKGISEGAIRNDGNPRVIAEQQILQLNHLAEKKNEENFDSTYKQTLMYHARAMFTNKGMELLNSKLLKNI